MTTQPLILEPLEDASNIDDVVRNLDLVVDWSIRAKSTIGYFAVLYGRGTVAVQEAAKQGKFRDAQWVEQLDVCFAKRYFDALNAFFHPDRYDREALTLPWEVAFLAQHNGRATMLQHMIASLNAHICYDLGIAVVDLSANRLEEIKPDFEGINDIVATQTESMLAVVQRRSPAVRWIRWAIPGETKFIRTILGRFREGAWHFAIGMALSPEAMHAKRVNQVAWTAGLGAWYLEPPQTWSPAPLLVRGIARSENTDVAGNIRALRASPANPTARRGIRQGLSRIGAALRAVRSRGRRPARTHRPDQPGAAA